MAHQVNTVQSFSSTRGLAYRYGWILLSATIAVVGLLSRSIWPIDETRYVTVAWEMWLRGEFLVPHLNGAPYSDKPPLLFWLIQLGWWLFGVNDWWPRVLNPAVSIGCGLLTRQLAKLLWPNDDFTRQAAPWLMAGSLYWLLFNTMLMFDVLISLCALSCWIGLWYAAHGDDRRGWIMVALGLGLGVLAKGPVMLVHLLPAALAAPWWWPQPKRKAAWYPSLLLAVLAGALIALLWAVPAALHGGTEYADAIFWGQSADRMVNSFAHKRPLWWYLPVLLVMWLPWILWRPAWRALQTAGLQHADAGIRFLLAVLVPGLVIFSLISGKQPHYLLPFFPLIALLLARGLHALTMSSIKVTGVGLFLLLSALAMLLLPFMTAKLPADLGWLTEIKLAWALPLALGGLSLCIIRIRTQENAVMAVALGSALWGLCLFAGVIPGIAGNYDLKDFSVRLATAVDQQPWAFEGTYRGQFQFLGRLQTVPIEIEKNEVDAWLRQHPQSLIVGEEDDPERCVMNAMTYCRPYRGHYLIVKGAHVAAIFNP